MSFLKRILGKDPTLLDVIDRELQRLHSEMNQISWTAEDLEENPENKEYMALVAEISKLNDTLSAIALGGRNDNKTNAGGNLRRYLDSKVPGSGNTQA